ncbi:hypothetical protein [Runella sp.]|uniref:hypothetical protein n=1 Tax=Runella sp. TaxID=1960881 RepID=UPI003D0E3277
MTAALFESESKNDLKILMELAKKLGIRARYLSSKEFEEHVIAHNISEGMKSSNVSRDEIMKALGK